MGPATVCLLGKGPSLLEQLYYQRMVRLMCAFWGLYPQAGVQAENETTAPAVPRKVRRSKVRPQGCCARPLGRLPWAGAARDGLAGVCAALPAGPL